MKKIPIISIICSFLVSCNITLSDNSTATDNQPPQQLNEKVVIEECRKGNPKACELQEWLQKQKDKRNKKILEDSGVRDRSKQ